MSLCILNIIPIVGQPRLKMFRMTQTSGAEPLTVSIKEAVRMTSISRSSIYRAIKAGRLPARKLGARTLIPLAGLRRLVQEEGCA